MEFKYINDRNKTPNAKPNKKFSNTISCDSPFRFLPNFSTPPSRFTKIINPFESHLIDRLHLPTFSPSVFAKVSTPKTEDFKWTIDDISSLKPADIDERTISQHVFEEDPQVESMVQQKIDTFFSEEVIVPSPMTEMVRVPLIAATPSKGPSNLKQYSEGWTQTVLTLPPKLPDHVEEALKPYFTFTQDQQASQTDNHRESKNTDNIKDTSLYRKLFEFDQASSPSPTKRHSPQSSLALSASLSPVPPGPYLALDRSIEVAHDMLELRDCNLSPIGRKSPKESRSACRLNFSSKISMDVSVVPDIANQMSSQSIFVEEHGPPPVELLSNSTVNWDMEYKHVSFASPSANSSQDSEKMDICNSDTPHSKIFTSQRKRLSDSFKDEEDDFNKENEPPNEECIRQNRKIFRNNVTDTGYHTEIEPFCDESLFGVYVFSSTPTKRHK